MSMHPSRVDRMLAAWSERRMALVRGHSNVQLHRQSREISPRGKVFLLGFFRRLPSLVA